MKETQHSKKKLKITHEKNHVIEPSIQINNMNTQWVCSTCTYLNTSNQRTCEMCDSRNPNTLFSRPFITSNHELNRFPLEIVSNSMNHNVKWTCTTCTMKNSILRHACSVCGSINSQSQAMPSTIHEFGKIETQLASINQLEESREDEIEMGDTVEGMQRYWICQECNSGLPLTSDTVECPICNTSRPGNERTVASSLKNTRDYVTSSMNNGKSMQHKSLTMVQNNKQKNKARKNRRQKSNHMSNGMRGISGALLRKFAANPTSSQFIDTLQSLTHTLAIVYASYDGDIDEIGDSMFFGDIRQGSMQSALRFHQQPLVNDTELLPILQEILANYSHVYNENSRLLAIQAITYLIKMNHQISSKTLKNIAKLFLKELLTWTKIVSSSHLCESTESANTGVDSNHPITIVDTGQNCSATENNIVKECLSGIVTMKRLEHMVLQELSTTSACHDYMSFVQLLCIHHSDFHKDAIEPALTLLHKIFSKISWNIGICSSDAIHPTKFRVLKCDKVANSDSIMHESFTKKVITGLCGMLDHDSGIDVTAMNCLQGVMQQIPSSLSHRIIKESITSNTLAKFIQVIMRYAGKEKVEARHIIVGLVHKLLAKHDYLLHLFFINNMYCIIFRSFQNLVTENPDTSLADILKLIDFLSRSICQNHISNGISSINFNGHMLNMNSLPDPNVIHKLLLSYIQIDSIPIVRTLIKLGADISGTVVIVDEKGMEMDKPLHVAVEHASLEMVQLLVSKGADIYYNGPSGTALHIAALNGRCEIAAFLIRSGLSVSMKDQKDRTVLEILKLSEKNYNSHSKSPMMLMLNSYEKREGSILHEESDDSDDLVTFEMSNDNHRMSLDSDDDESHDINECEDEFSFEHENDSYFVDVDDEEVYSNDDQTNMKTYTRNQSSGQGKAFSDLPASLGYVNKNTTYGADSDNVRNYFNALLNCILSSLGSQAQIAPANPLLQTLATLIELTPQIVIESLQDKHIEFLADIVFRLLQAEGTCSSDCHTKMENAQAVSSANGEYLSQILAVRILFGLLRKSTSESAIFYQCERRGICELLEQTSILSLEAKTLSTGLPAYNLIAMGIAVISVLRNNIFGGGKLHGLKLKNLVRRLNVECTPGECTIVCLKDHENITLDLVELFEQHNGVTVYELEKSGLLMALAKHIWCTNETSQGVHMKGLICAFRSNPNALRNFITLVQTIVSQCDLLRGRTNISAKGNELVPLAKKIEITIRQRNIDIKTTLPKRCYVSPLTKFREVGQLVLDELIIKDEKLSHLYMNLVGHFIYKVVEQSEQIFLVCGYDNKRYRHLILPVSQDYKCLRFHEAMEVALYSSGFGLCGAVNVYDTSTVDWEMFGCVVKVNSCCNAQLSGERRSNTKRTKNSSAYNIDELVVGDNPSKFYRCNVEVKNEFPLSIGELKGAWYAGTIAALKESQEFHDLVNPSGSYNIDLWNGASINRVPAHLIRRRYSQPRLGSVVQVSDRMGEVIAVYPQSLSIMEKDSQNMVDLKMDDHTVQNCVLLQSLHFPPSNIPIQMPLSKQMKNPTGYNAYLVEDKQLLNNNVSKRPTKDLTCSRKGDVGEFVWVFPSRNFSQHHKRLPFCIAATVKSFPNGNGEIYGNETVIVEAHFGVSSHTVSLQVHTDQILALSTKTSCTSTEMMRKLLDRKLSSLSSFPSMLRMAQMSSEGDYSDRYKNHSKHEIDHLFQKLERFRKFRDNKESPKRGISNPFNGNYLNARGSAKDTNNISSLVLDDERTYTQLNQKHIGGRSNIFTNTDSFSSYDSVNDIAIEMRKHYVSDISDNQLWVCTKFPTVHLLLGMQEPVMNGHITHSKLLFIDMIEPKESANVDPRYSQSNKRKRRRGNKLRESVVENSFHYLFQYESTHSPRFRNIVENAITKIFTSIQSENGTSLPIDYHKASDWQRDITKHTSSTIPHNDENFPLWTFDQFSIFFITTNLVAYLEQINGSSLVSRGRPDHETIQLCILFSKYASVTSKRNVLPLNGFLKLLSYVCHSCKEAGQKLILYLLSSGYLSESAVKEIQISPVINTKVEKYDDSKLPMVSFQPEQCIVKCLEELQKTKNASVSVAPATHSYGNEPVLSNEKFSLLCDFDLDWASDSNNINDPAHYASGMENDSSITSVTEKKQGKSGIMDTFSNLVHENISADSFSSAIYVLKCFAEAFVATQGRMVEPSVWYNQQLCHKIEEQLQNALRVCARTYPKWCDTVTSNYKFLLPLPLRKKFFRLTGLDVSRSLQEYQGSLNESTSVSGTRNLRHRTVLNSDGTVSDENNSGSRNLLRCYSNDDISITPIPKNRVTICREDIIQSAEEVLRLRDKKNAILEISFAGEKGYGSGVTAEFYSTTAEAFQSMSENNKVKCWIPGIEDTYETSIRHPRGLYPFPYKSEVPIAVIDRFRLIGRLSGRALMDSRLFPLRLSSDFIKLVLGQRPEYEDLEEIFLSHGKILYNLYKVARRIEEEGHEHLTIDGIPAADWLSAANLSFVEPFSQDPLIKDNANEVVTIANVKAYVHSVLRCWFEDGIKSQVEAFRDGLKEALAIEKLSIFYPSEFLSILCGDSDVDWDIQTLKDSIRTAHGYTPSSSTFEYFIEVLHEMTMTERRAFLRYATGCPNLPIGGLKSLQPQFEVVRRIVDTTLPVDHALPFARTCTNTLHLPAYSSKAICKHQIYYAVENSKGVIDRD